MRSIAVSGNGRWLATGCADNTVRLWDLAAEDPSAQAFELRGHSDSPLAVAISDDSRRLATGSSDNTVRLWDLTVRDPSASSVVLRGHVGDVGELAYTPDNHWLITGSGDNTARMWSLQQEDLLASARDMAGRNFTIDEWKLYFPRQQFRATFEQQPGAVATAQVMPQPAPAQLPYRAPGM